ncbi:sushi domain-containing protein 3 [Clarias gariepinus]|uniref:sushi domain-containing protein 3 n=1 Tax=Clarias gariepinus TaxID=13013 RepID=UPI00234D2DC2|nr:sushi domain-containing protein 3 [Clarias gariepinus]
MESNLTTRNRTRTGDKPGQCTVMKNPQFGTFKLVTGNGTSVGTVMTLSCQITFKAFSGGHVSCVQDSNGTQWTGGKPECRPILYEYDGFRLAVLLSIVSVAIIMLMSIWFITSCLLNIVKKEKMKQHERQRNEQLWHQLNVEEQGHSFYNGNDRMTNNNNNNNNNSSSSSRNSAQKQHPRSHQLNFPEPLSIQLSQPTLEQMPTHCSVYNQIH